MARPQLSHPFARADQPHDHASASLLGSAPGMRRVDRRQLRGAARRVASKRGGFAIVWLALMVTVFMGVAAVSVDQGFHLSRKANAQKAADAAALAAAQRLATNKTVTVAIAAAEEYAKYNGYDKQVAPGGTQAGRVGANGTNQVAMAVAYPIPGTYIPLGKSTPEAYPNNWVRVQLARREPRFFGQVFLAFMRKPGDPPVDQTQWVGATSIAEFRSAVNLAITNPSKYGLNEGDATLSMFGPDGRYANGDFRSTKNLTDGSPNNIGPNPDYHADKAGDKDEVSGYNFSINMPANFNNSKIELFDPDCYNSPGGTGPQGDAATGLRVDEWRLPESASTGSIANATTTRFRLYADNGTPFDLSDDTVVDEKIYAADAATDMKWVPAFEFDRGNYAGQNFRLNVYTSSGSSENGFNIRAGKKNDKVIYKDAQNNQYDDRTTYPPVGSTLKSNDYATNGTSVTAQGYVPINFNKSGAIELALGEVPAEVAGRDVTIRKFDTDIGGGTVTYEVRDAAGVLKHTFFGVLSGNGEFKTDNITLPSNYAGGFWTAKYTAGIQDSSVWEMDFNAGNKGAARIKLVQ